MKDTKEHIINTATQLFLQKGFKEVTMKELVESAGVSKGAFYHYFTSKEQVFEEVLFSFTNSLRVKDYDTLSTTSLKEFYSNWKKKIAVANNKMNPIDKNNSELTQNHYYLLINGLRIIPAFRNSFEEEQIKEQNAWIKIIDIAKNSGEIKSILPTEDIAKLFIFVADGLGTNMLLQNKEVIVFAEVLKAWDNIYSLIK
ncbi:TetR/AcrR family transcriptional regulator [Flavobacterium psychrophilum]|uniref:TetR/AcrR family transcriptional regulator n=1 Tax=Flavobacterium psychrophilum TaxID=96345 RepID=UPI000B7C1936|nr:TetR/AcrR family transcriptional regulator [Flavobacterium psychrophilum]EKT4500631.1 TetR/AcrR family transcriptional regulator [Flavobacterium psychrophilum]MBF2023696.1 TetR/AcrR family transcriptional regulator [Flavobacterium psychrophilum]MCB5984303.1 TetR/AcrR family transcriptional regulator [Flavobacterium psychrophilum]MCB5994322.1 TetR/AcrR family transcriptional regulator [Flavobacterium psychrophilum]MCB5996471.1 TetR/AcrR family transcriptional regulator [Flavobacterium psychr